MCCVALRYDSPTVNNTNTSSVSCTGMIFCPLIVHSIILTGGQFLYIAPLMLNSMINSKINRQNEETRFILQETSVLLLLSFPSVCYIGFCTCTSPLKLKGSKSVPRDFHLSRRKHCSLNASSFVLPLILLLCDITLSHPVMHLHNSSLIGSLARKN